MFESKKRPEAAQAIHTLLGKGTLWKGEIHAGLNSLRIEGTVDGAIHSKGEVTIAPTGEVKGTIHAKHLIVTGRVVGTFTIVECLEIHGTGYVEGEVEVGSLVVDEGGTLQGNCTRRGLVKKAAALEATPTPVPEEAQAAAPVPPLPAPAPPVPTPVPASVPAWASAAPVVPAVGPAATPNRDELPSDRHVFNMANGVAPSPAGEHAYSKERL